MVPIGGEAFVYILIICIRLNRNYHLKLTNGEQGSLERESGTQQQWRDHGQTLCDQVSGTSSAPEAPRITRSLRAGTQSSNFSGCLGCAFGGCDLAGAHEGHPSSPAREGGGVCLWNQHKARVASPVSVGATWPCDSYVCPPTNDYPLFDFLLPAKIFQSQEWSLPAGSLIFWLRLSLPPILVPQRALFSVLQEQHASSKVPGGLTSLACGTAFLVQPRAA